ncbi:MAG: TIGR03960 family B12-binding radical SAM protein [Deltaproteobacteria bacterium]
MSVKRIQDVLPLIERPSRYLGSETNAINGIQILYHLLNRHPDIVAERVFAPAEDMGAALRSFKIPLMSLETRRPLQQFDIIGFSLLYELNYTNILSMLSLAGIPFYAARRNDTDPLIIAGGPCTCNPEPVADFFDAMVIGDGEDVMMQLAQSWISFNRRGRIPKKDLLTAWSEFEGVYVPSFFEARRDAKGFQMTTPRASHENDEKRFVKRAVLTKLSAEHFPHAPVVPFGKPVHDRLRLEISRGCTRGCRFCQAGMIYRPVRERPLPQLMNLAQTCLQHTGYEDISLLSLSTGDYSQVSSLIGSLIQRYASEHVAVSLPSLRVGTLTFDMMERIKQVRKTGFTFAPEAGSQRLRDVINKNISETEIVSTVKTAFSLGWQVVKLYFMIGLPTETPADIEAIVDLVETLRKIKVSKHRYGKINVSVATFIPKPHTPFQWEPQMSLEESERIIHWLKSKMKLPGVQFKWQRPETSYLEGLWARGDRRFSRLLTTAYHLGCRFDGWSDRFDFSKWRKALYESEVDADFYLTRKRSVLEPLPWDHVHIGVEKAFLVEERQRAFEQKATGDCRWEGCHHCGVCDFDSIRPVVGRDGGDTPATISRSATIEDEDTVDFMLCVYYAKTEEAKYFGHLEMVNIFIRTLRRMRIPMKFSRGFHPMPKISFEDPLPIGMESLSERFYVTVRRKFDDKHFVLQMNALLPAGLRIHGLRWVSPTAGRKPQKACEYTVTLQSGVFQKQVIEKFRSEPVFKIQRTGKKGVARSIDLKPIVFRIDLPKDDCLILGLKPKDGLLVRPQEVLSEVFGLPKTEIKKARIVKGNPHVQTDSHQCCRP